MSESSLTIDISARAEDESMLPLIFFPLIFFVLFRPLIDGMMPTQMGEGCLLLLLLIQMLISSRNSHRHTQK